MLMKKECTEFGLVKKKIKQLPESSTCIFMRNMLDWHKDRPSSKFGAGQYSVVNEMCFVKFLRFHLLFEVVLG